MPGPFDCPTCKGTLWVCENHRDKPFDEPDGCACGAGMPCVCNPEGINGPGWTPIISGEQAITDLKTDNKNLRARVAELEEELRSQRRCFEVTEAERDRYRIALEAIEKYRGFASTAVIAAEALKG